MKTDRTVFAALASVTLGMLLASAPAAAETLTVVSDNWCPYNCAAGSSLPGYGIEILQAIFEPQGIKVVYSNIPWEKALEETRAGKYGAVFGAARKDVVGYVVPEEETGMSVSTAFVKKGSAFRYAGPESLAGKKVVQLAEYYYDDGGKLDTWIAKNPASVTVVSGDDPLASAMRKVLTGEVDVMFEDKLVFARVAKEKGLVDKFTEAGTVFELPIYVGFAPNRPESKKYAQIYSDGIRELRKTQK
ncbi:transporter substrate-binding domain-containing protein, partial [bacterium]